MAESRGSVAGWFWRKVGNKGEVRLVCATMHASLTRWFQMGGTGLGLSLLRAKQLTQWSAIGYWEFIGM